MHACIHISNIIKKKKIQKKQQKIEGKEALMKRNTLIIRVKKGSANIKWCEKMRGLSQVHYVESAKKREK